MELFKISKLTGQPNTMTLPLSEEDYARLLDKWQKTGALIQDVFFMLNRDQREFVMTGATPEEWNDVFEKGNEWTRV